MIKINSEQTAYNLGYDNPSVQYRGSFISPHMVVANAYHCGQADAQNQAPRASEYRMEDYDFFPTFERKLTIPTPPTMEIVWLQNLKGFIEGKFPVDEQWKKIFLEQLARINGEEIARRTPTPARRKE